MSASENDDQHDHECRKNLDQVDPSKSERGPLEQEDLREEIGDRGRVEFVLSRRLNDRDCLSQRVGSSFSRQPATARV